MMIMESAAAATDEPLQVQVPAITKYDLAIKALEAHEPMRMVVLRALQAYGIQVPDEQIANRRIRRK